MAPLHRPPHLAFATEEDGSRHLVVIDVDEFSCHQCSVTVLSSITMVEFLDMTSAYFELKSAHGAGLVHHHAQLVQTFWNEYAELKDKVEFWRPRQWAAGHFKNVRSFLPSLRTCDLLAHYQPPLISRVAMFLFRAAV